MEKQHGSLFPCAPASMLTATKHNAELSYVIRCIVTAVGNNYFWNNDRYVARVLTCCTMKSYGSVEVFLTSAPLVGELTLRQLYIREKSTLYPLNERLIGGQSRSDRLAFSYVA
jgi:hypothetical protein